MAGVILGVKTSEVFVCILAIIFLGSIVLTSQWLLCINCFTSLVSFTGFYTEYEPMADIQPLRLHLKEIPRLYECLLFNSPNFVMVRTLTTTLTNSWNPSMFKQPIFKPKLSLSCYNWHALANGQIPCCQWKGRNLQMKQQLFRS